MNRRDADSRRSPNPNPSPNPSRTRSARAWLALCLALALALPVAALAWPGHSRDKGDHAERMQKKLDGLDLDADTRAQVEVVLERARESRKEGKPALHEAKAQMRELMHSGTASEGQLFEQAERVTSLELENHKQRIAKHLALRDLLTPEQLQALQPRRHPEKTGEEGECRGKRGHRRHHGDR